MGKIWDGERTLRCVHCDKESPVYLKLGAAYWQDTWHINARCCRSPMFKESGLIDWAAEVRASRNAEGEVPC